MSNENSGPAEGIKGVVEDAKGKAKEAVGAITGNDSMTEEGRAQQDKADAQRDAAKKEAEADAAAAARRRPRSARNPTRADRVTKRDPADDAGSLLSDGAHFLSGQRTLAPRRPLWILGRSP